MRESADIPFGLVPVCDSRTKQAAFVGINNDIGDVKPIADCAILHCVSQKHTVLSAAVAFCYEPG